jgi:hypothetical protein
MHPIDAHSTSDDALIARAADGDGEARTALAKRVRKLRWVGDEDEARTLASKAGDRVPNLAVIPGQIRDTD